MRPRSAREVSGSVEGVADVLGVAYRLGGLRVAALDERVALGVREAELDEAPVAIERSELEILVEHDGGTGERSLDTHAGPAVELVGELIDERRGVGHSAIVALRARRPRRPTNARKTPRPANA